MKGREKQRATVAQILADIERIKSNLRDERPNNFRSALHGELAHLVRVYVKRMAAKKYNAWRRKDYANERWMKP